METLTVLYDDAHLVVCVKPAGILSEDDGSPRCMPQLLREHYRALGQSEEVFAVHRLDREVGGVMVYSRRPAVTGKLTGLVSQRQMEKEYLAVLTGHPQSPADTLTDLLFRDAKCNKSYVVSRMRKGVREASLSYEELGRADALSLVCIRLHPGRTHQIRVQFSSRGLPLLGDRRYGSRDEQCRTALWSWKLSFRHPVTGKPLTCTHLPPDEYPWNLFQENLPK